ncbi:MAG: leucyl aminopeptidase [Pseudomonadales bacterium]|nr:leucyl aminopeptidase [Pseudomonadales bacterium]
MKYLLQSTSPAKKSVDCLSVAVWSKNRVDTEDSDLPAEALAPIQAILRNGDLSDKPGETLLVHAPAGINARRLLLVSCGQPDAFDARAFRKAVRAALGTLLKSGSKEVVLALPVTRIKDRDAAWGLTQLVIECETAAYRYAETKSRKPESPALRTVSLKPPAGLARKQAQLAVTAGESIAAGITLARHLGNLPGNLCTPVYLAQQAAALGRKYPKLKTSILDEKQMKKLGMGSLLSVAAGSQHEARLAVMEYKGSARAGSRPYVLVGKGITFDTGGISLKPGAGMDEMKFDMCGAASVLGVMNAVAQLQLPINVVGVIATAENMPGPTATKPGDIVTSMSGQTIEILNTDAEGRLVLCDALSYVERFKPKTVIDIATLTGAAVATFGEHVSALLSNNDALATELLSSGQNVLDPAWQLPLWDEYQSLLDSNFADIANIGGPKAGTITAACFLSRFTAKYHWAHLDIAGTAWLSGTQKGATGRPVALLVEYLRRQKA